MEASQFLKYLLGQNELFDMLLIGVYLSTYIFFGFKSLVTILRNLICFGKC